MKTMGAPAYCPSCNAAQVFEATSCRLCGLTFGPATASGPGRGFGTHIANVATQTNLEAATGGFRVPLVMRHYDSGERGDRDFQTEAEVLLGHGYEVQGQSEAGSHLHAGRLLLTGGLSIFAGRRGIRSKGKITVTYRKV